ncbi:hypothetical protein [Halomonas jincaotanensis]|uniref:hypothetical protein n=1 Tax=Halomonas jincaotanensis TaxID=2810616 RepID=UPI001BD276EA|nr:hypothetical protein [Halomonas jincaotanensis]
MPWAFIELAGELVPDDARYVIRQRFARPVRLIVSVEAELVESIDRLMTLGRHHGHRIRAELLRQAIEQERCQSDAFLSP